MSYYRMLYSVRCILFIAALGSTSSQAALIETALPSNAHISLNGFDWAWGASCVTKNAGDCDTLDAAFQVSLGWRIAEAADMAIAPTALDFIFPGANVAFNGADPISGATFDFINPAYTIAASSGACATAYFTLGDGDNSCDWGNGGGQDINTRGWFNQNGESRFFADVLFIRDIAVVPVSVPAVAWLFGIGLLGLIGMARRRTPNKKLIY